MSRSEIEYLRPIRDEAPYRVETICVICWDPFSNDGTLKRAFVRGMEVIGEPAKTAQPNAVTSIRKSNGERWPGCAIG
jgi:uncharacterized protein with HEPN domain